MRLGESPCQLVEGTLSATAYEKSLVHERHRHRFEFNNAYREHMEGVGLWPAGLSPDGNLVEIMEVTDHPFMVVYSSTRNSSRGQTGPSSFPGVHRRCQIGN